MFKLLSPKSIKKKSVDVKTALTTIMEKLHSHLKTLTKCIAHRHSPTHPDTIDGWHGGGHLADYIYSCYYFNLVAEFGYVTSFYIYIYTELYHSLPYCNAVYAYLSIHTVEMQQKTDENYFLTGEGVKRSFYSSP